MANLPPFRTSSEAAFRAGLLTLFAPFRFSDEKDEALPKAPEQMTATVIGLMQKYGFMLSDAVAPAVTPTFCNVRVGSGSAMADITTNFRATFTKLTRGQAHWLKTTGSTLEFNGDHYAITREGRIVAGWQSDPIVLIKNAIMQDLENEAARK